MTDKRDPVTTPSMPAILWIGACGLLVVALAPLPYGYYQFLRLVICGVSAYVAWLGFQQGKTHWGWAFVVIAILYNPFLPVHLTRGLWRIINVATAVIYVLAWSRMRRPESSAP